MKKEKEKFFYLTKQPLTDSAVQTQILKGDTIKGRDWINDIRMYNFLDKK